MEKEFIGRPNQLLKDHLYNVAHLTENFASVLNCSMLGYVCGLLHDIGKYSRDFQDYLQRSISGQNAIKGEVVHSHQGAYYVVNNVDLGVVLADIIANVLASHHGELLDMIYDNGSRSSIDRLGIGNDSGKHIEDSLAEIEKYCEAQQIISEINEYIPQLRLEFTKIMNRCCGIESKRHIRFYLHLYLRFLYSCLIDADRCDAGNVDVNCDIPNWQLVEIKLENYLSGFGRHSEIAIARGRFSNECFCAGNRDKGVYRLSLPTGSGKTLSSLRFAIRHAQRNKLKRIIYVIPYLSIIDQTADELRKIFGDISDELILEHHSNLKIKCEPGKEAEAEEKHKLLTSRWDSPIIITTMVQFLETIFSNKASDLRKFHNMSETVFVFDEIQSLPLQCTHLFNSTVNFLHAVAGSSFLLCTATQPLLHRVERPIRLTDSFDLVTLTNKEEKLFSRTRIIDKTEDVTNLDELCELIREQIGLKKSILVVMNTKKYVELLFDQLTDNGYEKVLLTTNLCPAHRRGVIKKLRESLSNTSEVLCISTQLIEAGVDVSFDCVIRDEAGMNSVIQAAGRCNRHGEHSEPQSVYVVDIKEEDQSLQYLPEILLTKQITKRVLDDCRDNNIDISSQQAVDLYNKYYFGNNDVKARMDYPLKNGGSIYEILGTNMLRKKAYEDSNGKPYPGLPSAFQTAADEFGVINGDHIGVVVQYGDANDLVSEFEENRFDVRKRIQILKELQQYTVTVYSSNLSKILEVSSVIDDTFYLLSKANYDPVKGMVLLSSNSSIL